MSGLLIILPTLLRHILCALTFLEALQPHIVALLLNDLINLVEKSSSVDEQRPVQFIDVLVCKAGVYQGQSVDSIFKGFVVGGIQLDWLTCGGAFLQLCLLEGLIQPVLYDLWVHSLLSRDNPNSFIDVVLIAFDHESAQL